MQTYLKGLIFFVKTLIKYEYFYILLIKYSPTKGQVAGSNPAGVTIFYKINLFYAVLTS